MRSWTEHENTFRTDALQVSQAHRHVADFEHLRLIDRSYIEFLLKICCQMDLTIIINQLYFLLQT